MKLIAMSGSLRTGSFNTALLHAAQACLPKTISCEIVSIAEVPLYNQDLDGDTKPEICEQLKAAIADADGLLIATPEYNYSVPGGLKNAIDWLSRPAYKSVLAHKPVAIMSSSLGATGGVRAQGHLKQIMGGVLADIYPAPEFCVPFANQVFSTQGELIDEELQPRLTRFIGDYCAWLALKH